MRLVQARPKLLDLVLPIGFCRQPQPPHIHPHTHTHSLTHSLSSFLTTSSNCPSLLLPPKPNNRIQIRHHASPTWRSCSPPSHGRPCPSRCSRHSARPSLFHRRCTSCFCSNPCAAGSGRASAEQRTRYVGPDCQYRCVSFFLFCFGELNGKNGRTGEDSGQEGWERAS